MSLSKYPEKLDLFQVKRDAAFDGDPNGDDVMADDINALQDAISAIETALGTTPQGNKLNVGERISLLENSAALRVPSFLIYLGQSDKINGATSVDEATAHFMKFDHIVLGNDAEDISSDSHEITTSIIANIKSNRDIKIYGYIDCSVNTTNLSIADIQIKIKSWQDMGADGIYLDNFGYDSGVTRDRQNQILDSVHQYGMVAIMQSGDSEKLLTNAYDSSLNPNWTAPNVQAGDVYHYQYFAVDTSHGGYTDLYTLVQKMIALYTHRKELGIRIFATPYIASGTDSKLAQTYYEWAHIAALLTSLDGFYPASEGYAKLTNTVPTFNWVSVAGNWYMNKPTISIDSQQNTFSRETAFGTITMTNSIHDYTYDGLYIPYSLLNIAANTMDGSTLKDSTIEDAKIKSYDGKRLIDSINADTNADTINISKIATFSYGDVSGSVSIDALKANVVDAINAYIGTATIGEAFIGNLHASKITAGDIDAQRLVASVVDAINLHAQNMTADSAKIGEAVIGDLHASKITAGDIDAARLQANVVSAINVNAQGANITDLNATHITAGDIAADRIKTNVVNAINAYAQQLVAGQAVISSAAIGQLTAQNIQAAVINAINTTTDTAVINSAKIGSLSVDNMKAAVVEAINLKSTSAQIDQARIGDLDASKITTGSIDADRLTATILSAINASIETATINQAKIGSLDASKIATGDLDAERIQANVVTAINSYAQTMTANSAVIDIATVGEMDAKHIQSAVIDAINLNTENAVISNAKIGQLSVDNMKAAVISAINATLESASIDQAHIGVLDASKITTGDISVDRLKAGVISAINASIESATIGSAKIGILTANNIGAHIITTDMISTSGLDASIIMTGYLSADRIQARSLSAEVLEAHSLTSNEIAAGGITATNMAAGSISADALQSGIITAQHISTSGLDAQSITVYDSKTGQVLIGGGYMNVDGLDVGVVQSDNLIANGLFLTSSSSYGFSRSNPDKEAILGGMAPAPGGNQVWKINAATGEVLTKIDIPGGKPVDIAINTMDSKYAYITVEGDDTLVQLDLGTDTLARDANGNTVSLKLEKGPGRIKYSGDMLGDMKHLFVLMTDPDNINIPDSIAIIDSPPTSINSTLYTHHFITLGDTPYDYTMDKNMQTYVTQAGSGDIAVIDMSNVNSMFWHVKYTIPLTAMGTDNYHGGLPGHFGLNQAVGGSASSQYNTMSGMAMPGMGTDNPYGASDGTMKTYTPHGIAQSSDPNILYVLDYENGELIVVDKLGQAPYNDMSGSRQQANLGPQTPGGTNYETAPPNAGTTDDMVPSWITGAPGPVPSNSSGAKDFSAELGHDYSSRITGGSSNSGGMTMSVGEPVLQAMDMSMPGMDMGSGTTMSDGTTRTDLTFPSGGGPTTPWVWYRISVGDSPDFIEIINGKIVITLQGSGQIAVLDEQMITNQLQSDYQYYNGWDIFMPPAPLPMFMFDYYDVGSQPSHIWGNGTVAWITLNGQNQVVSFDTATNTVTNRINVGNSPKGLTMTKDGAYLYVVNYGGGGLTTFVYPQGDYIGDPYLGLEGGIEYQGGSNWTPDRTDWVYDAEGNVQSSSTVEFRINEPFLNEGGYVKLTAQGINYQKAQVEQDMYNVENYSNGNNVKSVVGDRLKGDATNNIWYPTAQWLDNPAPANIKIGHVDSTTGQSVFVNADPATYTIYYAPDSRIVFTDKTVPLNYWVIADYTYQDDKYFKTHNGSILLTTDVGSTPNFNLSFEIDEFVPKFISIDNQQTSSFTPTQDGINEQYNGLEYSIATNRAAGMTVTSSVAPTTGVLSLITNNEEPDAIEGDVTGNPSPTSETVTLPSGLQSVTIDLGKTYMIGKISVAHSYGLNRTYHGTKTEVSQDGINWVTIYDSAVSGEYNEAPFYHTMHGHTHYAHFFTFTVKPVRYIRDWANGWTSGDGTTSGTTNDWTEIKAYGDWEVEYDYLYPSNSVMAGQQIATNGKCVVSTDIPKAYVAMNVQIEFTSWWYMTYLVSPDFGELDVEMITMGMSHSLFQMAPYLNKYAHRHIMSFPPSNNIKADTSQGIEAGKHRVVIRQKSGRITLDRFRFEDFQHYTTNYLSVQNDGSAFFTRHKIVAEQAKWYVGQGNQSTYGAYDTPRLNQDTGERDYSVALKYRMRVKAELNVPNGGTIQERGVAYATSAIFETGKLSTHWRRSESTDNIPGNRIESWDSSHPGKTGIQTFHLANGVVKGAKLAPFSVMDYHINPYARIREAKLDLNYPTHRHGRLVHNVMPNGMDMPTFVDNKDILDEIEGWYECPNCAAGTTNSNTCPTCGTQNTMARGDHSHDSFATDISVTGNINVTGNVDGVDVSQLKSDFDTHTADTTAHLTSTEHTKLTNIADGATKTQSSATNGNITINGVDTTVYTHPTTAGSIHLPSGGAVGQFVKYSGTAGTGSWSSVDWTDLTNKPLSFTPPIAASSVLGGVKIGTGLSVDGSGNLTWSHPAGAGNNHIPTGGSSGQALKYGGSSGTASWGSVDWTELSNKPTTFTPAAHTHALSDLYSDSAKTTSLSSYLNNTYATKSDLASAGGVSLSSNNTFTGQNIFTKYDGPAIVLKPSQAPAANTVLMQMADTSGNNLVTFDAAGDVTIVGNLNVNGTTTYSGTNSVNGDYDISGNLSVGGTTTLGAAATDQTTVTGDLRVEGTLKQVGTYVEVHRRPLFGIAGDLQFQTDDTTFDNVVDFYDLTLYANPTAQTGATRYYRLYVIYSDDITSSQVTAGQKSTIRIAGASANKDIDLIATWGSPNGRRDFYSSYFTDLPTGNGNIQAQLAQAGNNLGIRWIELIAYDKY